MGRFMQDVRSDTDMSAESSTTARPVDLVHLARHTFGNRDLEIEILQLFRRQSQLMLQRLEEADDASARRMAAHTIKGSALGIGAWRVAKLAGDMERLSAENSSASAVAACMALGTAVSETNGFIRSLIEH